MNLWWSREGIGRRHAGIAATTRGAAHPVDIVELIGNPRPRSRTRSVADALTRALAGRLGEAGAVLSGPAVLELAEYVAISFGNPVSVERRAAVGPPPSSAVPAGDPLRMVCLARLLIVATPAYKGTFTGLLKIFLDQLGRRALAGVVAVPVGVAACEPHRRAVGTALSEVLVELGAAVPGEPLAVLEADVGEADAIAGAWASRHVDSIDAMLGRHRLATST